MSIYPFNYTMPIGFIPQVRHTYGYTLGAYAIMNEKQVSIGESTCSAKLYALAVDQPGGNALLNMIPLTEIALERCDTARCAVETMGALAEQYGFYGQVNLPLKLSAAQGEAGEALTISDTKETWMFHILADDTGTSAVWAAQKVPKGHITVCPNQVRTCDNYLYLFPCHLPLKLHIIVCNRCYRF
jgi:dipeptidase